MKNVLFTGGVDFNTTPLTATFGSGSIMSSVSVPLMADDIVELNEAFYVTLSISSSVQGIIVGDRHSATIVIADSTGKHCLQYISYNFTCICISCCKNY